VANEFISLFLRKNVARISMKIIESLLYLNKWLKLFSGALICILVFQLIYYFNLEDSEFIKKSIIVLAVPGVFSLIGLLEILTGVPFQHIARKWDDLAGWQRGILGVTIVVLSFALIFSIFVFLLIPIFLD